MSVGAALLRRNHSLMGLIEMGEYQAVSVHTRSTLRRMLINGSTWIIHGTHKLEVYDLC